MSCQRHLYLVIKHTVKSKLPKPIAATGPNIINGGAAYSITQCGCVQQGTAVLQVRMPPKHQQTSKMVY